MASLGEINIWVSYALADKQDLVAIQIPENSTVKQAIEMSGFLQKYEQIDLSKSSFGIYGKAVPLDQTLNNEDRVEIYRPLITDPMQARRKRANLQK